MTTATPTPVLNDAQMAERLKKAIERRDNANNRAIRVQTEADMSEKAAKVEAADAAANFQVDSLAQLREKTVKTYESDMAELIRFEEEVSAFEAQVSAAEKILNEAATQ